MGQLGACLAGFRLLSWVPIGAIYEPLMRPRRVVSERMMSPMIRPVSEAMLGRVGAIYEPLMSPRRVVSEVSERMMSRFRFRFLCTVSCRRPCLPAVHSSRTVRL